MIKVIKSVGSVPTLAESKSVEVRPIRLDLIQMSRGGGRLDRDDPDSPEALARARAEEIVRAAEREAEAIRQRAYDEGLRAKAANCARALDELVDRLESEIAMVVSRRDALAREMEPQALKLCVEAVEKILRHEIRTDPRVVERTVKACLRRVKDSAQVTVRVSPREMDHVRAVREELLAVAEGVSSVEIVEDRRIESGGCVVETDSGHLDARIETQLNTLRDKLTETLENDCGGDHAGPNQIL